MDYTNYKFIEMPIAFLQELIPANAKWGVKLLGYDANDEPLYVQRTADEFLLLKDISKDRSKVMCMLCAMPDGDVRLHLPSDTDLDEWDMFLKNLAYITAGRFANVTRDMWFGVDVYETKLTSPEYEGTA